MKDLVHDPQGKASLTPLAELLTAMDLQSEQAKPDCSFPPALLERYRKLVLK